MQIASFSLEKDMDVKKIGEAIDKGFESIKSKFKYAPEEKTTKEN